MEIQSAASFLKYFEGVRARTERVVLVIPPDQLEWRHKPGAFSIGDLVRHIAATERYMFAENVAGRPSRYPGHGRELADGFDGVIDYLRTCHRQAVEIIAGVSDADLASTCTTPAGTPITRWKWLRAMVEHEVHHRGQIYLMLNMIGVDTPTLYGLTSEEVRANSLPMDAE